MDKNFLVTGNAGFIGYHLSAAILESGGNVIGVDNLNNYYDTDLKRARQSLLKKYDGFTPYEKDFAKPSTFLEIFRRNKIDIVLHLGAQAGVRHSITDPLPYLRTNVDGSYYLLEACKQFSVEHLLMASTSSAYGTTAELPFTEDARSEHHVSFYAATKKSMETMAHSYSHVHQIPITVFRFFTVYGPWGRPDMALFKFAKAMIAGEPIEVYNYGKMQRDFTYVTDLVHAVLGLCQLPPLKGSALHGLYEKSSVAPYRLVNIGNSKPRELMEYIATLERALGVSAEKVMLPMQTGDIQATCADTSLLRHLLGFVPETDIEAGVASFVEWYRDYYGLRV